MSETTTEAIETRIVIEPSLRAAVAQFSARGHIPVNAATLSGLLLFLAGGDAGRAATLAVPLLGSSHKLLGAHRPEVDQFFDRTYANLVCIVQEEREAQGQQPQTG